MALNAGKGEVSLTCTDKFCKFEKSCKDIRENYNINKIDTTFVVGGEKREFTFDLIEGAVFGDTWKNCYLPLFDHAQTEEPASNTIIAGSSILKGFYVVYDMSP
jgi:hypothetical protein